MHVAVSGPVLLLPWLAALIGWPSKHWRPCSRPAHRPASRHRCGAVQGCIGQAMFATYLWRMGKPRLLSAGPAPQHGATADAQLALLWMILVRPAGSARARARARAPRSPCEPGAASCFGQAVARPLVSRKDGHECRARLLCKGGSAWGARCFLLQAAGDPNLMTRRHGSAPGAWRGRAGDAAAVRGDRRGDRLQDDQQQPVAQGCAARLRRCVSVTRTDSERRWPCTSMRDAGGQALRSRLSKRESRGRGGGRWSSAGSLLCALLHSAWAGTNPETHCAGGFLTRVPAAALALCRGGGFTLAERVFMAASWVPKVRPCSHERAANAPPCRTRPHRPAAVLGALHGQAMRGTQASTCGVTGTAFGVGAGS